MRAYEHDPRSDLSFGIEAATALGADPRQVFKTLVVEIDGTLSVAVVPVDRRIDLKALAGAAGGKHAALADPTVAERATGYVVGGISPLGQRRALPTLVDSSALLLETMLVSAGRRGLDVALAPTDLIALTSAVTADISRDDRTR